MSFWETFGAVFVAQSLSLSVAWLFKKFIEPKLDWAHGKLKWVHKKVLRGKK